LEYEYDENKYYIKKIGNYQYGNNPYLTRGKGYLEEGIEYLLVFYQSENSHYIPNSIPPVRFIIINGVPMICLAD